MRKSFVILYTADGRRRLQSELDRPVGEERLAFEEFRAGPLPDGVARAEYHDTDLGGRFLTAYAPTPLTPPTPKPPKPLRPVTTKNQK
jgi:hypothetical protein